MRRALAAACLFAMAGCGGGQEAAAPPPPAGTPSAEPQADRDEILESFAERFVKLALAIGVHDADYVDAYHGPAEWRESAEAEAAPLDQLDSEAQALIAGLDEMLDGDRRAIMLRRQAVAASARIRMLQGGDFSFDAETIDLYDAVAPQYDLAAFDAALSEIDALLPGDGPLNERVEAFRNSLAIPGDRLQAVFDAAIAECRRRTLDHYELPENERFTLEFVTGKPWSGYNWYQGDFESLIQINTDLPVVIDRAVDLGCHEGYPGHHTWNMIIERDLLEEKGWIEYAIYPLFSPLSLIAEGSANYGIDLAFPGDEKIAFERDVLFPLAGLDPSKAATLDALNELRRKLSHADNHVAREYLDGRISRDEAVELLMKYKLNSRERAEQRVDFIETYRGYVINYNLGLDLVGDYMERRAGSGEDAWAAFGTLLKTPMTASDLAAQ